MTIIDRFGDAAYCIHGILMSEACVVDGCCRVSDSTIAEIAAMNAERHAERIAKQHDDEVEAEAFAESISLVSAALDQKAVEAETREERVAYAEAATLVRKLRG